MLSSVVDACWHHFMVVIMIQSYINVIRLGYIFVLVCIHCILHRRYYILLSAYIVARAQVVMRLFISINKAA
jgi:hypothetical protein